MEVESTVEAWNINIQAPQKAMHIRRKSRRGLVGILFFIIWFSDYFLIAKPWKILPVVFLTHTLPPTHLSNSLL